LRQLASLNPGKDLRVFEGAVAGLTGEATLLASREEGWHTIVPEFNELCDVPRVALTVKALTLDDLFATHEDLKLGEGPPRVVIKIDAEGAELDILRGGGRALALPSVRAIIMECTGGPGLFRERARECIRLLKETGWEVSVITHAGRRAWDEADTNAQINILASRR
jgi:FkbM family methyltransferase